MLGEWEMNAILLVILVLVIVVCMALLFWQKALVKKIAELSQQHQSQELLNVELQTSINQQSSELSQELAKGLANNTEIEQVSRQLEHRIKTLQDELKQLQNMVEQLQQQQPEDKLYSRALKLVSLGADVEEVMRECEMPRVEAELLFSIHQRQHESE